MAATSSASSSVADLLMPQLRLEIGTREIEDTNLKIIRHLFTSQTMQAQRKQKGDVSIALKDSDYRMLARNCAFEPEHYMCAALTDINLLFSLPIDTVTGPEGRYPCMYWVGKGRLVRTWDGRVREIRTLMYEWEWGERRNRKRKRVHQPGLPPRATGVLTMRCNEKCRALDRRSGPLYTSPTREDFERLGCCVAPWHITSIEYENELPSTMLMAEHLGVGRFTSKFNELQQERKQQQHARKRRPKNHKRSEHDGCGGDYSAGRPADPVPDYGV